MDIFFLALAVIISYLLGSINFSILISKIFKGEDIRKSGSGNAGATNMLRTYGKGFAVITLLLDVLKGVLGIAIGIWMAKFVSAYVVPVGEAGIAVSNDAFGAISAQAPYYKLWTAFAAVLGHNFPVFFKFKGGKGVATSLGAVLTLNWQVGIIVLIFALAIMVITRYVSLGSIMAAVIYVAVDLSYMIFAGDFVIGRLVFDVCIAALLIFRHKDNIKRLLGGTERKLGSKKEE